MKNSVFKIFCKILLLILLSGCNQEQITSYRVPKEDHSSKGMAPFIENTQDNSQSNIQWKVPKGWEEQPPSALRQASFLIRDKNSQQADMSVVSFPGLAGGDLANVNRWRGQLQLEPISETELVKSIISLEVDGDTTSLFEMVSKTPLNHQKTPSRLLGAILHHSDRTWFFKMLGDHSLVLAEKPSFISFLKSIRFSNEKPTQSKSENTATEKKDSMGSPLSLEGKTIQQHARRKLSCSP